MRMFVGLVLALALTGCGGANSSDPNASASSKPAKTKAVSLQVDAATCRKAVGGLLSAEDQLNSRLDVGIPFADYTSRLGDISVSYNQAVAALKHVDSTYRMCVNKVALPLQRGFNDYKRAGDIWNNCIQDTYCTFDKGSPELKRAQAKWTSASVALGGAQQALSDMP